jgi:hypothetical protein
MEALQAQLTEAGADGAASDVQITELTMQLRQARQEARDAAEADAARKGRGRWARLGAAWRGE